MSEKITSGGPLPELDLPLAGGGPAAGGSKVHLGGAKENRESGWQMIVVYRGLHCPICKTYLGRIQGLLSEFNGNDIQVVAVSGDPADKAETAKADWGFDGPIAYGMTTEQMKAWGLYISDPRSAEETDRPFPEPALFVVRPDGNVQIAEVANAPFVRPDPDILLGGLKFIQESGYPIRGTGG